MKNGPFPTTGDLDWLTASGHLQQEFKAHYGFLEQDLFRKAFDVPVSAVSKMPNWPSARSRIAVDPTRRRAELTKGDSIYRMLEDNRSLIGHTAYQKREGEDSSPPSVDDIIADSATHCLEESNGTTVADWLREWAEANSLQDAQERKTARGRVIRRMTQRGVRHEMRHFSKVMKPDAFNHFVTRMLRSQRIQPKHPIQPLLFEALEWAWDQTPADEQPVVWMYFVELRTLEEIKEKIGGSVPGHSRTVNRFRDRAWNRFQELLNEK